MQRPKDTLKMCSQHLTYSPHDPWRCGNRCWLVGMFLVRQFQLQGVLHCGPSFMQQLSVSWQHIFLSGCLCTGYVLCCTG